jgi:hypothetical protein
VSGAAAALELEHAGDGFGIVEPVGRSGPDPVLAERSRRAAATRARKRAELAERQRRAAERRNAAKAARRDELDERAELEQERIAAPASDAPPRAAPGAASSSTNPDEEWAAWVRSEFARPLTGPDDLAELLGKLQMTLIGVSEGTPFADAAWSLQWTDGVRALRRAQIGARCLWPWMRKNGHDGVRLAEQSEGLLAAIGVTVLIGPSLRPTIDAIQKYKRQAPRAAVPVEQPTSSTEGAPAAHA